jgi:hypothetical protein
VVFAQLKKRLKLWANRSALLFWVAVIGMVLLKLYLVSAQPILAIGWSWHDDRLFLNLTHSLLGGAWLGPLNDLTLAKGCFYPIWMALISRLGIPLMLSQHLLYLVAVLALVVALRPLGYGRWRLLVLGALLWFNPGTYTMHVLRVIREGIYPALTLLVVAGSVGTLLRSKHGGWRPLWPWLLLSGLSLSAFWQTREEGVWLLPLLACSALFAVGALWRRRAPRWWSQALACVLPLAAIPCSDGVVALVNKARYGIAVAVEFRNHDFLAAYGALTRVKPKKIVPHLQVSKEMRELVYPVSPAFAALKPQLDGAVENAWCAGTRNQWPELQAGEIGGGWFVWAFRQAVARAGYYASGEKAMTFYRQLARDVDSACKAGKLDCLPARATMMPPWVPGLHKDVLKAFASAVVFTAKFDGMLADPGASSGSESTQALYRKLTHDRIAPLGKFEDVQSLASKRAADKIGLLNGLLAAYRTFMPVVVCLALLVFVVQGVQAVRKRKLFVAWVIQAGLLAALLARLAMLALIEVTSFPAIGAIYLSAAYPVLIVLVFLALCEGEAMLRAARRGRAG